MGCLFHLQGIFPTQGLSSSLLCWQVYFLFPALEKGDFWAQWQFPTRGS